MSTLGRSVLFIILTKYLFSANSKQLLIDRNDPLMAQVLDKFSDMAPSINQQLLTIS